MCCKSSKAVVKKELLVQPETPKIPSPIPPKQESEKNECSSKSSIKLTEDRKYTENGDEVVGKFIEFDRSLSVPSRRALEEQITILPIKYILYIKAKDPGKVNYSPPKLPYTVTTMEQFAEIKTRNKIINTHVFEEVTPPDPYFEVRYTNRPNIDRKELLHLYELRIDEEEDLFQPRYAKSKNNYWSYKPFMKMEPESNKEFIEIRMAVHESFEGPPIKFSFFARLKNFADSDKSITEIGFGEIKSGETFIIKKLCPGELLTYGTDFVTQDYKFGLKLQISTGSD